MQSLTLDPAQAAQQLLHRRKAREDLCHYAASVPVPGSPLTDSEDERIPLIVSAQADHHRLILREMQDVMSKRHGRLMIMAPPGSAKSTYATVVAPTWFLGTNPKSKVILATYGDDLARKHGRRTRQLLRSREAEGILQATLDPESRAADEFALTNGSEYMACGILGGITGNRAHGIVIDDPIKGRQDADSETIRNRTWEAYQDDLLTRLIPGGWVVIINTRWHEDDLSGRLLPDSWAGESGDIMCRDGQVWRVLCLQAECTTGSDPMQRKIGEMLWPQWFDAQHWAPHRLNRRTWSSLFQQIPAPSEGLLFRRDDMMTYERAPDDLRIVGASDMAVTPDGGDWTELAIGGYAPDGTLYLLDWWRGQVGPEEWIERKIDMISRWSPIAWIGEAGPIRRAIEGRLKARMTERRVSCRLEWLPSINDKPTRAQPAIALAGMGKILYPRAAWVSELQRQMLVFPAGQPDDAVDTLGLLVRGCDMFGSARRQKVIIPQSTAGFIG
ncbi:MAG: terminase large subunit domain-containing protein [Aeromonas sp.]